MAGNGCDIIIPVWNQPESTGECVESVLQHTRRPYRIIIVDNASLKPTRDYLNSLTARLGDSLITIRNEENLGFAKAVNQGIAASRAPYICVMNNDTVATDGWLDEMIKVAGSDPKIGLVNPSSNTRGRFMTELKTQELSACRGFCMLLKREVVDSVGLLDEVYGPGYFEETDYCKRAREKGYRIVLARAAYVYHKEGLSFKARPDSGALFKKNERIFFERWGRPVRVAYILDKAGSQKKVDGIARTVADSGHQILIFTKKASAWPVTFDHFDVRRVDVGRPLFGMVSFYKILERRKKKGMDVILTDNRLLGGFLKLTKRLHGASVLVDPGRESLIKMLSAKSRQF